VESAFVFPFCHVIREYSARGPLVFCAQSLSNNTLSYLFRLSIILLVTALFLLCFQELLHVPLLRYLRPSWYMFTVKSTIGPPSKGSYAPASRSRHIQRTLKAQYLLPFGKTKSPIRIHLSQARNVDKFRCVRGTKQNGDLMSTRHSSITPIGHRSTI
jgi:hypothetical protein